ncbi:TIGR00341 family protein [Oceanibium sediminis]|uniref:TIGR00341 family protein n=1 Tax=Oceanibium sediminis TaxID=2026339 RepID=UPI000DD4ABFC|nr:TIGR00341 family protein [Oceanibium sediminis]
METRIIQIILPHGIADKAAEVLEPLDAANWWRMPLSDDEDSREQFFVLTKPHEAQDVMDKLSACLEGEEGWRQILLPVEAVAPDLLSEDEEKELRTKSLTAAREEILADVRDNAALTPDYLVLTGLSTVVAAIGLNHDQVAAVIGAMVIAPLLGPLMGLALGVALGLHRLLLSSALSLAAGLGVCVLVSAGAAMLMTLNQESQLLNYTQPITLSTMALALASGAAAGLATTGSKTSSLVGVMVAAAVLPPVAAAGLLLAGGEYQEATRASFIVIVNVVCITLAAQIVFISKGVRPRQWSELKAAETSSRMNLVTLGGFALVLAAVLLFWDYV